MFKMELLTWVYLFFIFVSLYFTLLFLVLFWKNKSNLFEDNKENYLPTLSVLIPAHNEEKSIRDTIKIVLDINYPKNLFEVIVIDDGSTDNTLKIVKEFKGIRILSKENSGKADSLNKAIAIANNEIIVVVDADSYPDKDSFLKMVPYFFDKNVGAVTSSIMVKNPKNLIEKLQSTEYIFIAFARKLLDAIGSVYVTPGPLSMYRKDALLKIGGFDKKNLTEDIEIAWNLLKHNYDIRMCLSAKVYTNCKNNLKTWWKQRVRWNVGGLQTIAKYKGTFGKKNFNMLGLFVTPFFIFSWVLSLLGLFIFGYFFLKKVAYYFLFTNSVYDSGAKFNLELFNFNPTVFTFFVIFLLILTVFYIFYCFNYMKETKINLRTSFILLIYLLFYLAISPFIHINAIFRFLLGNFQW